MDTVSPRWSELEGKAIREQLARIIASSALAQSQRRQRFLSYVVEESLAGRGDRLKGYTIGVEVFERPADFDPAIDPIVRIEATRLRDKLREYYETDGRDDPVRIELPKGSYAPLIEVGKSARTIRSAPQQDAIAEPQRPPSASVAAIGEPINVHPAAIFGLMDLP